MARIYEMAKENSAIADALDVLKGNLQLNKLLIIENLLNIIQTQSMEILKLQNELEDYEDK